MVYEHSSLKASHIRRSCSGMSIDAKVWHDARTGRKVSFSIYHVAYVEAYASEVDPETAASVEASVQTSDWAASVVACQDPGQAASTVGASAVALFDLFTFQKDD